MQIGRAFMTLIIDWGDMEKY